MAFYRNRLLQAAVVARNIKGSELPSNLVGISLFLCPLSGIRKTPEIGCASVRYERGSEEL